MKTDGVSGGPTTQALIPGLFLRGRWLRNKEAGVLECWTTAPSANCARRSWSSASAFVCNIYHFTVASKHLPNPAKPN
jgi:hypothetical protein